MARTHRPSPRLGTEPGCCGLTVRGGPQDPGGRPAEQGVDVPARHAGADVATAALLAIAAAAAVTRRRGHRGS